MSLVSKEAFNMLKLKHVSCRWMVSSFSSYLKSLSLYFFNILHSGICLTFLDIILFRGDCVLRFCSYFCLLIAKCCLLSTFYGVVSVVESRQTLEKQVVF